MLDEALAWNAVRAFMQAQTGVVLAEDQAYLMEARLAWVARQHGFASASAFACDAVAQRPGTARWNALIDAMTTHESSFFRDAPFWKNFEDLILPSLLAERAAPLRIWSAACGDGQEAYSVAMLLDTRWPDVAAQAEIYATDISPPAIERGRYGLYSSLDVNRGVGAVRLMRYFDKAPGGFRIKDKLRERIQWHVSNLLAPKPITHAFDIVLCRNVLIYFGQSDRKSVVGRLSSMVQAHGYLGMGNTESVDAINIVPGWYQPRDPAPSARST